jgi:hypothetical protein
MSQGEIPHNTMTRANVLSIPYKEFLDELWKLGGKQIPEGRNTDPGVMQELDMQLAYFANMHAWVVTLWGFVTNEVSKLKLIQAPPEAQQNALKRKETLYEFAGSIKLKQEAVSRRITVWQETNGSGNDRRIYGSGQPVPETQSAERPAERPTPARTSTPAKGGWGRVT